MSKDDDNTSFEITVLRSYQKFREDMQNLEKTNPTALPKDLYLAYYGRGYVTGVAHTGRKMDAIFKNLLESMPPDSKNKFIALLNEQKKTHPQKKRGKEKK